MAKSIAPRKKPEPSPYQKEIRLVTGLVVVACILFVVFLFWLVNWLSLKVH